MARTDAGSLLTAQHRRAQIALRAAALRDYMTLWPLWDGRQSSFGRLVSATIPLVRAHHRLSAAVAGAYYQSFRAAERVGGAASPRVAGQVDADALAGTLYVTGRDMTRRALQAGQSPQAAMSVALVRTAGTVGRFVLAGGRDTILGSTTADDKARGWSRVTSGIPCAFCAMLAGRGPVYRSEGSADFRAHDHCACIAEPYYEGAAWPGRAREFADLWNQHATGDNPLEAFRRAFTAQTAT